MPRIASFSFFADKNKIAGDQVPAVAFWKWCQLLDVDCDLVTNANSPNWLLPWHQIENPAELNDYDAVFFSTMSFFTFDFTAVEVPYCVMLHGEYDKIMYGGDRWCDSVLLNAKCVPVIGKGFWANPSKEIEWHPCTLPEYLIRDDEKLYMPINRGNSLIYSARLASSKGWDILAHLSKNKDFMSSVDDTIHVYGSINKKATQEKIEEISPDWTIKNGYSVYDEYAIMQRNQKYKFFWDVFYNRKHKIEMKRLNLSAYEAIKSGCIPIVDERTAPELFLKFGLPTIAQISSNHKYLSNISDQTSINLIEWILETKKYSFEGIKSQVEKIIHELLS